MTIPYVEWKPSPNFGFGRQGYPVIAEVKHRIVGTLPSATRAFMDMSRAASTHFGIGYVGGVLSIHQYVDLSDWAWGNGDVRDPSWPRLIRGANPNFYTVSTEHEDGGEANRGVVSDEVWAASIQLSRILRCGDVERIRRHGIRCRDEATAAQLAAMPIDEASYIDHNQISGPNKPYCFRRWLDDPGFIEGSPSRRDLLLAALKVPLEDDMAPVTLLPVRQEWMTGTGDVQGASRNSEPGGQFFTGGPGLGDRKWFVSSERVTTIAETADGLWRLVLYGAELLWMHRYNLRPIDGARFPATGFGLAFDVDGITEEQAVEREKKAAALGARFVAGAAAKAAEGFGG